MNGGTGAIARGAMMILASGFVFGSAPARLVAQSAQTLATTCQAQAGGDPTMCARAVGAGRDLAGDIALLAGSGGEIPGQASTLGRRIGGSPRFAPWIRAAVQQVVVGDLTAAAASAEPSFLVPSLQGGLGLGLFDGLNLLPTVGGFLSLDVVGQASFLFFPSGKGFDGRVDALSIGARVGILRESFTLPGVTLSVSRRLSGSLQLGDTGAGDAGEVALDPGITSLRATVGKDLFAFGVLLGVGWDDFSAETTVRVTDGAAGFASASSSIDASRRLYFLGLSRQLGVLSWISLEAGWAQGLDPVAIGTSASPDRGSVLFGSLSLLFKI